MNARNVSVQDVQLGFGFGRAPAAIPLLEGNYVAVQTSDRDRLLWDWGEWVFDRRSGQIVAVSDRKQLMPYNYLMVGISRASSERTPDAAP